MIIIVLIEVRATQWDRILDNLIDWDSPGHGYFLSKEEIADYPEYSGIKPRVGDFVYKDMNDDDSN